jgi:hypothetical protein
VGGLGLMDTAQLAGKGLELGELFSGGHSDSLSSTRLWRTATSTGSLGL